MHVTLTRGDASGEPLTDHVATLVEHLRAATLVEIRRGPAHEPDDVAHRDDP